MKPEQERSLLYQEDRRAAGFRFYFPQGIYLPLLGTDIHKDVMKKLIDEEPLGFHGEYFAIAHRDESVTYGSIEMLTDGTTYYHLADFTRDRKFQGKGIMLYEPNDPEEPHDDIGDHPQVVLMTIEDEYKGLGLEMRRIQMMNALAHVFHKDTLYSSDFSGEEDPHIFATEKPLWEQLAAQGKAVGGSFDINGIEHFRFIE